MPPSRPFVGPRAHQEVAVGADHHEGGAAAQLALRASPPCAERSRHRRAPAPRNASVHGHSTQAGFFGVQIVAPRSIMACAKSPARRCGVSVAASARISGLAPGSSSSTAKSRAITRSILPSTGAGALVECDRGDRGGRIGADAGQRAQAPPRSRETCRRAARPRPARRHAGCARARSSRAPPRRLSTSSSGAARQRLDVGPARQEARVIRRDRLHGGLLQHDLGQPDTVRVGPLARRARATAACGGGGRTRRAARTRRGARARARRLRVASCAFVRLPCPASVMEPCAILWQSLAVNKPRSARPLADSSARSWASIHAAGLRLGRTGHALADIVGAEIAAQAEPMKINGRASATAEDVRSPPRWCCASRGRRRSKSSTSPA